MKKLMTLVLVFISLSTFARVGKQWFNHKLTSDTEESLMVKIQDAIPLIKKGKIRSVFQNNCWPNNERTIKIKNVTTSKAYKYVNDELVPYYVGKIRYMHTRCRD